VLAAASLFAATLAGCAAQRGSEYPCISQVPPRDGKPIDQNAVYPEQEKVILKKVPPR
jgi:hypothetical protein